MSDSLDNRARVFRIGRECYVIYLGSDQGDLRPFLRIGNMPNLPDEVHKAVSTVIVSENHVGNPLQEVVFSSGIKKRYIGDTAVAGIMRRFFRAFSLSAADNVVDYKTIRDGEKRHMVWFYSNGNIHLHFDDEIIFDLGRREREDRHFSKLYEDARELLLQNPARYVRHDFKEPGFICVRGNAFWYENGKLLSLNTGTGFVTGLMYSGIDPNYIEASAVNLHQNQMELPGMSVLFGFMKHFRRTDRILRIITSLPELPRKLKLLFPTKDGNKSGISVSNIGEARRATFEDSLVSCSENMWSVQHAGLPDVFFGSPPRNGLSVDTEAGRIQIQSSGKSSMFRLLEGIPVNLAGRDFSKSDPVKRYAVLGFDRAGSLLSGEEGLLLSLLSKYIVALEKELGDGTEEHLESLETAAQEAEGALRRIEREEGSLSWFYLSNAESLLSFMLAGRDDSSLPVKTAKSLMSLLRSSISRSKEPASLSPFVGDLYTGKHPVLMWRPAKNNLSQTDLEAASATKKKMVVSLKEDRSLWHKNLQRLLSLIESLSGNRKGALGEEQMDLLTRGLEKETPSEEPDTPKPRSPLSARREQAIEKPKDAAPSPSSTTRSVNRPTAPLNLPGGGGGNAGGTRSSSRRIPLRALFAILPILILLGLAAWDLSGTAVWGRFLGRERTKTAADSLVSKKVKKEEAGQNQSIESEIKTGEGAESVPPSRGGPVRNPESGKQRSVNTDTNSPSSGSTARTPESENSSTQENPEVDLGETSSSGAGRAKIKNEAPASLESEIPSEQTPQNRGEKKSESTGTAGASSSEGAPFPELNNSFQPVNNRVPVTLADIHLAANEIATLNGYKDLDYRIYTGNDPDWIFPGSILNIPENQTYIIKEGDTIWSLAIQEIRRDVRLNLAAYDKALAALKRNESDSAAREILRKIAAESKASAMRSMASAALSR